ncbi:MAG: hypothetical protein JW822_02395 [Spirochaetales bacterium]|nr:hypothetical protein [Spirochaetales bacterium]
MKKYFFCFYFFYSLKFKRRRKILRNRAIYASGIAGSGFTAEYCEEEYETNTGDDTPIFTYI